MAASLPYAGAAHPDVQRPWYLGASPPAVLRWLVRLRWTTAVFELVAAGIALAAASDFPLRRVWWLLALTAAADAFAALWLSRGRVMPRPAAAFWLSVEIVLLAGLLELTGGPFNPFTVIFAVYVTLGALTLGAVYGTALGIVAASAVGILLSWHSQEVVPGHHELLDFPTHLLTLWVAFTAVAELAAYFVVQASDAVSRREQQIQEMRERAARTDHIMSLATLTAGAAHELSTPLATIALAARELEHAAAARGTVPDLEDDARLIRTEVDRCRSILDQMSGRAGGITAGDPEPIAIGAVLAEVRARLAPDEAERLQVHLSPGADSVVILPRAGLSQALLSLVRNAFDASRDSGSSVDVVVVRNDGRLRFAVHDRGAGMPPDVLKHAGEPFFTTKEPGRGLGLGLFLARVFAERLGGRIAVESADGTTVSLELPVNAESDRAQAPVEAMAVGHGADGATNAHPHDRARVRTQREQ